MQHPIELFLSYAHEDEALMNDVRRRLSSSIGRESFENGTTASFCRAPTGRSTAASRTRTSFCSLSARTSSSLTTATKPR